MIENVVEVLFYFFVRLPDQFSQVFRVFADRVRFDVFPDVLSDTIAQWSARVASLLIGRLFYLLLPSDFPFFCFLVKPPLFERDSFLGWSLLLASGRLLSLRPLLPCRFFSFGRSLRFAGATEKLFNFVFERLPTATCLATRLLLRRHARAPRLLHRRHAAWLLFRLSLFVLTTTNRVQDRPEDEKQESNHPDPILEIGEQLRKISKQNEVGHECAGVKLRSVSPQ